ncbi:MAG: acyltransferase [Roseburia sp.]|nr:acyltransferase [Ruminococcus sp.]MCM1154300.1 acyltransferase [Roseburia sp.]MCM1241852.1 acyltransferase [Roseburia sp.]
MERKKYIDNIRWITVVLVVIYHVIYMYNAVMPQIPGGIGAFKEVQYQDGVLYILYPWFMVLLFVVSGISSRYYLVSHTDKEFVRSRTRKLLVPSTIGLVVFQWILGYYSMSISNAFETMSAAMPADMPAGTKKTIQYISMVLSGTGVLWYIQVLWVLSLVLVLIRKIEKDRLYHLCEKVNILVLILLVIPVYGAAQILNTPVIVVYRFGIYGISFLIGYFVLSHEKVMEKLSRYRILLAAAAVCLAIAYVIVYFGENYAAEPVINSIFSVAYGWCAVLAVLALMRAYGDKSNRFSIWMSQKSWGLYVFHYLALAVAAYYLHVYAPDMPAFFCYLLVAAAAFGGGFLLYEIISRIPVIRWCVLGMKKK